MKRHPRAALLLVDFINPIGVARSASLARAMLRAATRTARLKERLRPYGIPFIYANDNFGQWTSEFSALVESCAHAGGITGRIVKRIGPQPGDHSILKPRHSAFFDTPLDFLLRKLEAEVVIVTGTLTDSCITFTAHDAHLRRYGLWIPRDCVAAERPAYGRAALIQMQRTLEACIDGSYAAIPRALHAAAGDGA